MASSLAPHSTKCFGVPYANAMRMVRRQLMPLIRISMLVLLVFGVLVRPVLNHVGELHDVEHAAAVAAEHGHAHADDGHDADHDPDHIKGSHGLLHQADTASSAGILTFAWFQSEPATSARVLVPVSAAPLTQRLSSPFRPPIA